MSWLFIDTHERGRMRLALLPQVGRIRTRIVEGRISPVVALSRILQPNEPLKGVCVVKGPGPFSVIRAGVLVANILARMKCAPLIGIPVEKAEDLEALRDELYAGAYRASQYVAPIYDAEPNIG
jgi:hypothetical protein